MMNIDERAPLIGTQQQLLVVFLLYLKQFKQLNHVKSNLIKNKID